jgi:hypothetical protein
MYDPEYKIDERLAAAIGIYGETDFRAVPKGCETEIKALVRSNSFDDFALIRTAINNRANRVLDPRTYEVKDTALVTLNIDTVDRTLFRNGLSGRVRFEFNPFVSNPVPKKIDISVKTRLSDSNVIFLTEERGEWEAKTETLDPNLMQIVDQNAKPRGNDRPVPDLIKTIPADLLFVESIGAAWRRSYLTTHRLPGSKHVVLYEHTEDCCLFTTPYCDVPALIKDREAEAEIKGIMGENVRSLPNCEFQELTKTSIDRTEHLIRNISPSIKLHNSTKSQRASQAVNLAYGELGFNGASFCPVTHALSQGVRPQHTHLDNLGGQMARLHHKIKQSINMPQTLAGMAVNF